MSWDVIAFDYQGSPPPLQDWSEDLRSLPLGSPDEVRTRIDAHLPGVDWSDPAWGIYGGRGFSFEFNLGKDESIDSVMVHVRGGGDAIAALLKFATPNGWSLLDCSTTEWIDPANPSSAGWEGFQAFRDRAIESARRRESE
jgi:hypothetical protein